MSFTSGLHFSLVSLSLFVLLRPLEKRVQQRTRRENGAVVCDEPSQPRVADRRRARPPEQEGGDDESASDEEREDAVGQRVQGGDRCFRGVGSL